MIDFYQFWLVGQFINREGFEQIYSDTVADRIGTTQSAVARLESAEPKHSPSIATLQKYAKALGYTVQVKLVKERRLTTRSNGPGKTVGRSGAHGK